MKKIVINTEFGGFSLSEEAIKLYAELKGIQAQAVYDYTIERDDPALVKTVETLGQGPEYEDLRVVEIPDDVKWHIHDYDGKEHVAEDHRCWH